MYNESLETASASAQPPLRKPLRIPSVTRYPISMTLLLRKKNVIPMPLCRDRVNRMRRLVPPGDVFSVRIKKTRATTRCYSPSAGCAFILFESISLLLFFFRSARHAWMAGRSRFWLEARGIVFFFVGKVFTESDTNRPASYTWVRMSGCCFEAIGNLECWSWKRSLG